MHKKNVVVIGSGFAGMSSACFLAKYGYKVTVLEKHNMPGGRARQYKVDGFSFDMGPSWYWMPDVFERFFNQFNHTVSDYYSLTRLDPSYRVYWNDGLTDIPASYEALKSLFEKIEPGSAHQLDKFLAEAAYKYKVGIGKLVFKPGQKISELFDTELLKGLLRLDVFTSMQQHVARFFKHPHLKQLMEFPVIFLGAMAQDTPALYSLMNFADIKGGTWFPKGGMYSIVDAMYQLAQSLGVEFHFGKEAKKIVIENNQAKSVVCVDANGNENIFEADIVVSNADYNHTETALLEPSYRNYSENYWENRVMAPGCLLYYVGINKKIENIPHHSLFFDTDFNTHSTEIYKTKKWPSDPLFYACAASLTDSDVAPEGCENLFFLIPAAAGLTGDTDSLRDTYFDAIIDRFEKRTNQVIKPHIIFKKSFAHSDFISEYNAFKGNAYGLANTLFQTAHLKPAIRNKKVKNLFYTGQLTVPGPGVPPALISGEVVAGLIKNDFA